MARAELARVVHARQRGRSRVGPQHRRRVASDLAGRRIGDEASIERRSRARKGDALFDARHRFVLSFGYELPRLDGPERGDAATSLGGWQLNGIIQGQTGFPLTVINRGATLDIRY